MIETDPLIEEVQNQCQTCAHWSGPEKPTICAAFPDGIPLVILLGGDHTVPYLEDGVEKDHGLRYEPFV